MLYPRSSIPLLLGFGSGPMFSNPRSTLMEDDGEDLAVWLLWCVPCDATGPCLLVADILKIYLRSRMCRRLRCLSRQFDPSVRQVE
jgi:hypothetical protein